MAFVVYSKPFKGHRSAVIPRAKALELQKALKHPDGLNKAQAAYIKHIKAVYLGKSLNQRIIETKPTIQTHWSETDLKEQ